MSNQKLTNFIEKHQLFGKNDKVLVALSGGADSVALLRMLLNEGYLCEAAHCNFHLRGEESDRDEEFVRMLCQELDVKLYINHFRTADIAAQRKISIEMAARDLRYEWFEQVRRESEAKVIAVAHHQDDNVETMLLNLLRGSGLQGLLGIRPKNGYIVRPLLTFSRQELLDYLKRLQQDYVTDSTNLQDEFTRNKIRLQLLPLMEEINPATRKHLLATAKHLEGVARIYEKEVEEAIKRVYNDGKIHIPALQSEPSPEAVLYELLRDKGFNQHQLADILKATEGQSGKQFFSEKWMVLKDRDWLIINELKEQQPPKLSYQEMIRDSHFHWTTDKHIAYLDADKIEDELYLRKWQEGDWFVPLGMKGKKLVSDYLTDRKFSRIAKEQQYVLCHQNDIVWLVGERIDQRYCITDGTKRVLIIVS